MHSRDVFTRLTHEPHTASVQTHILRVQKTVSPFPFAYYVRGTGCLSFGNLPMTSTCLNKQTNIMETVNCTTSPSTHYCGRQTSIRRAIGDPADFSDLGNPFAMHGYADEERARVIAEFKTDLWSKIKDRTGETYERIKSLPDDAVLGCFCKPYNCHCDVIIEASKWIHNPPTH